MKPSEEVMHYRENSDDFLSQIQLKQYCINNLNLSFDTTDIVAMVCFAEAYNVRDIMITITYAHTDIVEQMFMYQVNL